MDRHNAPWMTREDERILEYLDCQGLSTPSLISEEVFRQVSPPHVRERLEYLEYAGLVYRAGLKSWELTTAGEEYMSGDLDASDWPTPTVARVLGG